jgi:uncharacterized membrane protein
LQDLAVLIGVVFKGVDGLVELIDGALLLITTPAQLLGASNAVTAGELSQDPP